MANPYRDEIIKLVTDNPHQYTYQDVANIINNKHKGSKQSWDNIRGVARNNLVVTNLFIKKPGGHGKIHPEAHLQEAKMPTKKELKDALTQEAKERRLHRQNREADRKIRIMQEALVDKDRILADLADLKAYKVKPIIIKPRTKTRSESTAVALFSDLHVEEVVECHKVDGLNEYRPDIAKARSARFFDLVVRMVKKERQDVDIHNLVLWLGGDFFSSNLHAELPAACALKPMEAAYFSLDIIIGGIDFILAELPDIKLCIPTSVGNHSRTTEKVYVSSEQEHSIEWLMYQWIARHYKEDKRVQVLVANSTNTYVDIYQYKIRFAHGHVGLKYNQGLAGIHGPLRKKIEQVWNKQVPAYMTCIGHYHQYIPSSRSSRYVVNGSVIGTSPYGMQFGHEDPTQAFFLINRDKGLTVQIPLLLS
jgi:hypothetical protein